MGMGRMVSDREILSMSALGVPIRAIMIPVLVLGVLVSIGSFFTNDILLPAGTIQYTKLYRKILTSTPALELESNSIKRNQTAIVISGNIENGIMDKLLLIDTDSNGSKRIIAASGTEVKKSENPAVIMTLKMGDPSLIVLDKADKLAYDVLSSKEMDYNILARNVIPTYANRVTPREMSSIDLYREVKIRQQKGEKRTYNLYRMEFHKKFTIPFGAFFFVILAFPLALMATTNGISVGFIFGLIIAVLYWVLQIAGQTLSQRLGFNGALMMWIPNGVVFVTGLAFLGRKFFQ
jgi:lipopolysaccharide export system permease protein